MEERRKECVSIRELFERLVTLETTHRLKCIENEKALVLARELIARESCHFSEQLEVKLINMNNFQHKIDQLTGTLVSKEQLEREVRNAREMTDSHFQINAGRIDLLAKLIYVGLGIVLALEVALRYIYK